MTNIAKPVKRFVKVSRPKSTNTELFGDGCRAWVENDKYYFEFDSGGVAAKFLRFEITEAEFQKLRGRELDIDIFKHRFR